MKIKKSICWKNIKNAIHIQCLIACTKKYVLVQKKKTKKRRNERQQQNKIVLKAISIKKKGETHTYILTYVCTYVCVYINIRIVYEMNWNYWRPHDY